MTSFNILLNPVVSFISIPLSKPYSKHFEPSENSAEPQTVPGTRQLTQRLLVTEVDNILNKNTTVIQI